jgi:flagellar hook assembly protein FlgD
VHLRLGIPASQAGEKVRVDVFDVTGRLVRCVSDKALEPGYNDIEWNGMDTNDKRVSSGIYFVHVSRKDTNVNRKIVLVR